MSTKVFRNLVKFLIVAFFGYGIYMWWQQTAGHRSEALMVGLRFGLFLGVVLGALWLFDRKFGSKRG